nr:RNA-directed DNA polymerase, eukaryota [Tanacetum cinerariifolium]
MCRRLGLLKAQRQKAILEAIVEATNPHSTILYPRIYALEVCKNVDVASKLLHASLDSSFRRLPRGGAEQEQFDALRAKVEGVLLVNMKDRWSWSLEGSGEFSVDSIRRLIDDKVLPRVSSKTRWIKVVPIKINVHNSKVRLDCLPTIFNISRRGLDIDSIICLICDNTVESTRHIFFTFHLARDMLR